MPEQMMFEYEPKYPKDYDDKDMHSGEWAEDEICPFSLQSKNPNTLNKG